MKATIKHQPQPARLAVVPRETVMQPRGNRYALVIVSLAICCPIARAQSFSTEVEGLAVACSYKTYSKLGKKDITGHTSDTCKTGAALSSAQASLDKNLIAMGTVVNQAGADADAEAVQTATLKPPKGFNGSKVQFNTVDSYALKLSGLEAKEEGTVEVCLRIAQLGFKDCHSSSANGVSGGTTHHTFILKRSSKGFQLTILKQAEAMVTADIKPPPVTPPASGSVITSATLHLILPKGWTCTYDSGTSCP